MKTSIRRRLVAGKRRIAKRLNKIDCEGCDRPILRPANIRYELAQRTQGMTYGGIGSMLLLVRQLGLAEALDQRLHLLKIHLPYHESDHVLNFAFNALCDGTCLEDLELRRQDEAYLDAANARRIPDLTTAGDFCRRFQAEDVRTLLDVINKTRLKVWARQPAEFFEEARLDMDGTLVPTTGECKQGMDIAYHGVWGDHPLMMTLANTGEVLSIVNRSGNRPSQEGCPAEVDRALDVCLRGGFRRVLLRGDTDFTQTKHLDRWSNDPRLRFIIGVNATPGLNIRADDLPNDVWKPLQRPARYQRKTQPRARKENVKQRIVVQRQFENIRLIDEEVTEFEYRPTACRKTYRLIVIKKYLDITQGQSLLFHDYRYVFYLTNEQELSAAEIVLLANDRCDQENLHAQLKGGVRAWHAPVDNLLSNWAYLVMTALAWNLKAWWALYLPEQPEKQRVLRMEFKTFLNAFLRLPCQIVHAGRRLIYRLLGWNPWSDVFFRLVDRLHT